MQGFSVTREFAVLRACNSENEAISNKVRFAKYKAFDFDRLKHCYCISPSYEHSCGILKLNPDFYDIAYTEDDNTTAFCVFSKENGQIMQIGYSDIQDLRLIIKCLLSKYDSITAKNIDLNEYQVLKLLYSLGFNQAVKQFEMVKSIK